MKLTPYRGSASPSAALLATGLLSGVAGAKGPSNLTLKTAKGELAAGAEVVAESTDLIFETSVGKPRMHQQHPEGDAVEEQLQEGRRGDRQRASTGGEPGGLCKTTTPLGPTEITTSNLPWSDRPEHQRHRRSQGQEGQLHLDFPNEGGLKCTFEASKVKSTFTIGGPVVIHTAKQKFKANKKTSGAGCPKEGTLTGTFKGTSGGETVESELT